MAKDHTFIPGEALTAEKMNTLLQDNQIVQNYDNDDGSDIPEDYILSAKGVKEKLKIKYTVDAQEITAQGLAENAVTTQKIADNSVTESKIADNAVTENKLANGVVTKAKIADNSITNDKIGKLEIKNSFTNGEASGDENGCKILFVDLPEAQEKFENKFMVFVYYGKDNGISRSSHGVHLLRTYLIYSSVNDTKWTATDTDYHSWSAYGANDNSCGYLKVEVKESKLKITAKVFDDLPDGEFFAQGWQLL